jgi:hypothetical protein
MLSDAINSIIHVYCGVLRVESREQKTKGFKPRPEEKYRSSVVLAMSSE